MTARSKSRALVCVLLALSLCAPILAIATPAVKQCGAAEFRVVAAQHSAVLLTRDGGGHDQARQRSSAPSLFTLIPLDSRGDDPVRVSAAVARLLPSSLWTGAPRSGRSPPAIS